MTASDRAAAIAEALRRLKHDAFNLDRRDELPREAKAIAADIRSALAAWNTRAAPESPSGDVRREPLIDVMASLAAAISLLERGGKKAAPSDKMFEQMLVDYRASLERARARLSAAPPLPSADAVERVKAAVLATRIEGGLWYSGANGSRLDEQGAEAVARAALSAMPPQLPAGFRERMLKRVADPNCKCASCEGRREGVRRTIDLLDAETRASGEQEGRE